jgi:hypothetical protein
MPTGGPGGGGVKIGFTGTRNGMTELQRLAVTVMLASCRNLPGQHEFHHGNCVGADADAAVIAKASGLRVVAHPCDITGMQADTVADETRSPKRPLDRNHDIVDETDILIAIPATRHEVLRSGTWATVRYWRRHARHHLRCVLPDGTLLAA